MTNIEVASRNFYIQKQFSYMKHPPAVFKIINSEICLVKPEYPSQTALELSSTVIIDNFAYAMNIPISRFPRIAQLKNCSLEITTGREICNSLPKIVEGNLIIPESLLTEEAKDLLKFVQQVRGLILFRLKDGGVVYDDSLYQILRGYHDNT